ncbi:MAG: AsmA-like C-terminal region-containing protein [Saprospiraceae bacterium]
MKKILWKLAKGTGLLLGGVLLLMVALPALFPGAVADEIKAWTNETIEGELQFSKVRLSFFKHFPALTLTLHDFSLTGSEPFAKDTLLAGKALSFGLDVASVFSEKLEVNTFFIDDGLINVQVDEQGRANYNIYKGSPGAEPQSDTSQMHLKIAGIFFNRCQLRYHDRSVPMLIQASNFSYEGRGDLANDQFDLESVLRAESFDFVYQNTAYIQRRRLEADLITGINTASLVFRFAKNNLLINKLPVDFSGNMAILKEGYDIDLNVVSGVTDFGNIFSALPPEYDPWFAETEFRGQSQIRVALKGSYRAATEQAPDLSLKLWVRDGLIRHNQAAVPLQRFWINSTVLMPRLRPDSLSIAIDTLQFELGGLPTRATAYLSGMEAPYLKAEIDSKLDLAQLDNALGLSIAELRGQLNLQAKADGHYRTGQNPDRIRPDTVITSIPAYELALGLRDGYFKYHELPLAVEQIAATFRSDCKTGKLKDTGFVLEQLKAAIGKGLVEGNLSLKGLEKSAVKADLKAHLQLEDLARAIPMAGYAFGGALVGNLKAEGRLDPHNKVFPAATGVVQLNNGQLKTPWYPYPIENLEIVANLKSNSYRDLALTLKPVAFVFEGQPFNIRAAMQNPDNLRYDIHANGTLDLNKIYQVFGIKGYALSGLLKANLDLQGTEADALAGRYNRLNNKGTLQLQNLELRSDDYPFPFLVPRTTLRFEQEKAWLENAVLRYRNNEFTLDGYAQNFISHVLAGGVLQGKLTIASPQVVVDDFMVFATPSANAPPGSATAAPASGVVQLPLNMDLTLEAFAKKITYGQTKLQDFKGSLTLQKGKLQLQQTEAKIAGATLHMEGNYAPSGLRKAGFELALKADSFDVKRAYDEIPLFREMASAAAKAKGLVSADYQLQGRLNDKMEPVYPSIKGKGVLTLEQVQFSGLKLFGAVSKATGRDSLNNPNLKAVVMRTSIANNIVTIERTKMKVAGFRPRIEGQTSLDGRLNLRFRLGLPPLGIVGIPMTITGSASNPIVKIRKGKEEDELEETEYDDER